MAESSRRIPQLDGIRGIAILLVIWFHYVIWPLTHGASPGMMGRIVARTGMLTWSGVDLFFVLSGFLIGGILIDARESPNYFRTFYIRRVFRILPIYLALVVPYLLVWSLSHDRTFLSNVFGVPMPWYSYLTFTQNFWLAHHSGDSVFLNLTWSLAVEEQFYLLLPTIIRLVPKRSLLMVSVGLALLSVAVRVGMYLHYGPEWGTAAYVLIYTRADALMLGVICAVLLRDRRWKELLVKETWVVRAGVVSFGIGVLVLTYRRWGMGTLPMCTLGFTCMALFYASILMLTMVSPKGLVSRICQARWLMWTGTIAYGLYLLHGFAAVWTFRTLRGTGPQMANWGDGITAIVALGAALAISRLSWTYFESKLVRLGHRFTYGRPVSGHPPVPVTVAPAE
jgi:peptidoglycan/LPS O-acetylase OafA/YrhL